jgi:hypothetical protein
MIKFSIIDGDAASPGTRLPTARAPAPDGIPRLPKNSPVISNTPPARQRPNPKQAIENPK